MNKIDDGKYPAKVDKIPFNYSRMLTNLIKRMLHKSPELRISVKEIL